MYEVYLIGGVFVHRVGSWKRIQDAREAGEKAQAYMGGEARIYHCGDIVEIIRPGLYKGGLYEQGGNTD